MESSRIFVRGLPPSLGTDEFKIHFSKQSTPTDAKLIPQRRIGYVGFESPSDAAKAVKYYNKSFIHMSRIGVELARSVGQQNALRRGANATIDLKRKHGRIQDNTSAKSPLSASNRRDDVTAQTRDEDPKLLEFLKVMQPQSKSKGWEEQATVAIATPKESPSNTDGNSVLNVESKNEYEPAPKRQKIHTRNALKTEQADRSSQSHTDMHEATKKESVIEEEMPTGKTDTTRIESDADWLRSRTNRLLGLIDDDDDDSKDHGALSGDDESRSRNRSVPSEPVDNDNAVAVKVEAEREAETPKNEGIVEPSTNYHETADSLGRLFIRNLTYSTTEDDLRQLFGNEKYGTPEEVS